MGTETMERIYLSVRHKAAEEEIGKINVNSYCLKELLFMLELLQG